MQVRKTVNQKVVIAVIVAAAIVAGFIFWRLASPPKKRYLPGVGEVNADGTPVLDADARQDRGAGTGRRGPGPGG